MASSTIQSNEEFSLKSQHSFNGNSASPESSPWLSGAAPTRPPVPLGRSYIPVTVPSGCNNGIRPPAVVSTVNGEHAPDALARGQNSQASGYTILVPANVRYRGVNMQLDLKLDQKTLAAAETLSRAVQDAVAAGRGVTDSTGTNGLSHDPTRPSSSNSTGLQVFENVVSQVPATQALFQESTGLSSLDSDMDSVPDALTDSQKLGESLLAKTGGRNPRDLLTEKLKSAIRQQKQSAAAQQPSQSYSLPSSPGVNSGLGSVDHPSSTANQRPALSSGPSSLLSDPATPVILGSVPGSEQRNSGKDRSETELTSSEMDMILNGVPEKKPPAPPKSSKKSKEPAPFCHYALGDKPCRQRSIVNYQFCIRHILNDPTSPYKMCAHMRKGGVNKPDIRCTNAIRIDKGEEFCSTHLIAMGRLEPKKRTPKEGPQNAPSKKKVGQQKSKNASTTNAALEECAPQQNQQGQGVPQSPLPPPAVSTPAASHYSIDSHQPNEVYQQQQHFNSNQTPGAVPPWHGAYPPPPSSGPYPSPGGVQPYPQQHPPGYHPQSPSFGSYGNSQASQPTYPGPPQHSPFPPAGYGMANGYGGFSPQTPAPSSAGFVYPSSNSVTPFDPSSHPSTPRPGSNLSQHGPYGPPSTPGSPWKQPTVPPRGQTTSNSDLMRNHPELASKLLVGSGEEGGGLGQSLEDSNQGPLFQGSNPYLVSSSVQNSLDPFGMLNVSPTSSVALAPGARQVSQTAAGVPLGAPLMFPSPVPSDQSGESQLSTQTMTPVSGTQPPGPPMVSFSTNQKLAGGAGLGASLPPLFGTNTVVPAASSFFGGSTPTSDYLPQGATIGSVAPIRQPEINSSQSLTGGYLPPSTLAGTGGHILSQHIKQEPLHSPEINFPHRPATLVVPSFLASPHLSGVEGPITVAPGGGTKKVIRLQQKKRRGRMTGRYYRKIPTVDEMCRIMEDIDFDKHDLFPLGLEPSRSDTDGEDDEESISGGDGCFLSRLLAHFSDKTDGDFMENAELTSCPAMLKSASLEDTGGSTLVTARHQLYLLKKQLRLERTGLRRGWAEGVAVASTSRRFPNTVGKALLDRNSKKKERKLRRNFLFEKMVDHSTAAKRCCQTTRDSGRCPSLCLPYSNHCYKHILYNIDQRLFRYCAEPGCQHPVLDLGMPQGVPGGSLCPRHTDRKLWMGKLDTTASSSAEAGLKRKTTKKYLLLRKHKRRKIKKDPDDGGEEEDLRASTPYEELEESEDGRTSNGSSLEKMGRSVGVCEYGGLGSSVRLPSGENEVSLASVAKDLGFEDHELTEMLNKFPDEAFTSIMSQDFGKNGDHIIRVEDQASVMDAMVVAAGGAGASAPPPLPHLPPGGTPHGQPGADIPVPPGTHSWADVEQFLLSEGYRGTSFAGDMTPFMSPPPPYPAVLSGQWGSPAGGTPTETSATPNQPPPNM